MRLLPYRRRQEGRRLDPVLSLVGQVTPRTHIVSPDGERGHEGSRHYRDGRTAGHRRRAWAEGRDRVENGGEGGRRRRCDGEFACARRLSHHLPVAGKLGGG